MKTTLTSQNAHSVTCACDDIVWQKSFCADDQICHSFSVVEFFEKLFTGSGSTSTSATWENALPSLYHSEHDQLPFREAFKTAYMHFNHFIKPQEQRVLDHMYLLLYLVSRTLRFRVYLKSLSLDTIRSSTWSWDSSHDQYTSWNITWSHMTLG